MFPLSSGGCVHVGGAEGGPQGRSCLLLLQIGSALKSPPRVKGGIDAWRVLPDVGAGAEVAQVLQEHVDQLPQHAVIPGEKRKQGGWI